MTLGLKLGDFLDNDIDDNSIDLVITDPPWGCNASQKGDYDDSEDYIKHTIPIWLKELRRVMKDGAHIYIYVPTKYIDNWLIPFRSYFTFKNILVAENMKTGRRYKNCFRNNHQFILFGAKGTPRKFNDVDWILTSESWFKDKRNKNPKRYNYSYPSYIPNTYKSTVEESVGHPDEKNTLLASKLIQISSDENDIVLDGFAGSGAFLLSAKQCKRRFIGFEKNKEYYSLAKSRLNRKI